MQGCFGIPELIGVAQVKRSQKEDAMYFYYELQQYSQEPPTNMTVTQMALQLLKALQLVHQAGAVHSWLDRLDTIRWHGDEIKVSYF